jgi:hypothetical protein
MGDEGSPFGTQQHDQDLAHPWGSTSQERRASDRKFEIEERGVADHQVWCATAPAMCLNTVMETRHEPTKNGYRHLLRVEKQDKDSSFNVADVFRKAGPTREMLTLVMQDNGELVFGLADAELFLALAPAVRATTQPRVKIVLWTSGVPN